MKKIIKTIPVMLSISMLFLCSCEKDEDPGSDHSYTDVMAMQVKSDIVGDASISPYEAIFDVSPLFNQGHLPFASNAGSVNGLGTMLDGLDKSLSYLVYCHSDGPSIAGAEVGMKTIEEHQKNKTVIRVYILFIGLKIMINFLLPFIYLRQKA